MAWEDELAELQRRRRVFVRLAQELNPQATNWAGPPDLRWGKTVDNKGDIPHPGTIDQAGQFNNALANFEFPIELPSIQTSLIDKDNTWRTLASRPSQNLLRRKVGYYLRQESDLDEIFDQLIAIGRVKTSSFPPGKVNLNLDIPGGDSLGAVLGRRRVNNADFPRALPENIDAVVPFVYGRLNNTSPIPAEFPGPVPDPPPTDPGDPGGGGAASCVGESVVIRDLNFETGYAEGGFAGISMTASATFGRDGTWGARSNGTLSTVEHGAWLGTAFGVAVPFTTRRYGVISMDILPIVPPSLDGGSTLFTVYNGLVIIDTFGQRAGVDGTGFYFDGQWSGSTRFSPLGVNPMTATWRNIKVAYRISSLYQDGTVWLLNPDGYLVVYVDDVEVWRITGLSLSGQNVWSSNTNRWGSVLKIFPAGQIDNFRVTECAALDVPDVPPAPSDDPEPPIPSDCSQLDTTGDDLGAASRGGWLRALLVDTGGGTGGTTAISDYPVPGGLAATVVETGDPAPVLSGTLVAGGEANTGLSYYYAITSIRNGVFSSLSNVVGPFSPAGANQRIDLSWAALSPTPDAIRVYRSSIPDFSQFDRYMGSPGDLPGTATSVSDLYPGYSNRGFPPSTEDPHWDLNYRQTNFYQISALFADGSESACSELVQVNLWPRNSPQTVRVTWNPPAGGPAAVTGYRVRRSQQAYHFEMAATGQFDVGGTTTAVDDNTTGSTAVSNCAEAPTTGPGGDTRPVYLLAGHALRAVTAVFVFRPDPDSETGEFVQTLMTEGVDYVHEVREINGNRYHVLIFNQEQRSATCQYYEVTANVEGATYEATVGGTLIEDLVDIVEHLFMNVIFNTYRSSIGPYAPPGGVWFTDTAYSPGLVNHPSFVDAKAMSALKLPGGRLGAGALVEKIDARQLIHDLLTSSGLDLYQYLGSWYVKMFEPVLINRSSLIVVNPNDAIIKATFEPTVDDSKMVNVIPYFAGPVGGFSGQGYLVSGERRDPVSINDYGEMISEPFYLIWTHDPATAASVVSDYLRQWSTPLLGAMFTAPVGWYTTRPSTELLVTSVEGLGRSGWSGHVCRALAVDLDLDTLLCKFTLRSINDLVP